MSLLADFEIERLCLAQDMINPYVSKTQEKGIISYGVTSYGYDARLGRKFKIFRKNENNIIDPLNPPDNCFDEIEGDTCIIPPNSYVLAHTLEFFRIPKDVLALCVGKSTYARWGIIVNVTPLEPEWRGVVTLEISNSCGQPVRMHAGMGICQFIFLKNDFVPHVTYKGKQGKYQDQTGITLGRIK